MTGSGLARLRLAAGRRPGMGPAWTSPAPAGSTSAHDWHGTPRLPWPASQWVAAVLADSSRRRCMEPLLAWSRGAGFNELMVNIWFGAIASLVGVVVGAVATYVSQERLWKRTTRRELYGNFVGLTNVCRDLLFEVSYSMRRPLPKNEIDLRWEKANARTAEMSALAAQVAMVATSETREAADNLEKHLLRLKSTLHDHHTDGTKPEESKIYRDKYTPVLKAFFSAASKELGFARK